MKSIDWKNLTEEKLLDLIENKQDYVSSDTDSDNYYFDYPGASLLKLSIDGLSLNFELVKRVKNDFFVYLIVHHKNFDFKKMLIEKINNYSEIKIINNKYFFKDINSLFKLIKIILEFNSLGIFL